MLAEIKAAMPMVARYVMAGMIGWSVLDDVLHHGEDKPPSKYNAWAALFAAWISIALLRMGGFWG